MRLRAFLIILPLFFIKIQLAAQWQPLPGPDGGNASSWTSSPDGVLWVGGTAGVFTSTDDGKTWHILPATTNLGQFPIQLDWDNGNLYMVGQSPSGTMRALWKSSDNGATWSKIIENVWEMLSTMSVFDARNDTIVVNTSIEGHASLDGGNTWQTSPTSAIWNIIGTRQGWFGSFYSTAYHWTGSWAWEPSYMAIDMFTHPRRILEAGDFVFIFFSGPSAQYLYKKTNDPGWTYGGLPILYNENEVSVAERNDTIFLQGGKNILYSTDGLQNWQALPANGLANTVRACLFTPSGAIVAITSNGVFRADAQSTDFLPTTGFSTHNALSVLSEGNGNWWLGLPTGLYFSGNNGNSWEKMFSQLPNANSEIRWIKRSGNHILAGDNTRFYYSPTHGANWVERPMPVASPQFNYDFSLLGHRLFYGDFNGTFYSDDWGATWQMFSPATNGQPILARVYAERDSFLAVGAQWAEVYLSRDTGATWQDFSSGLGGLPYIVYEMAIGPQDLFTVSGYRLMRSPLDAPAWQEVMLPVTVTAADGPIPRAYHFSGNNILAGIPKVGIYISTDGAISWANYAPTTHYELTNSYYMTDSMLVIATNGGIWYNGTIGAELIGGRVFADADQNGAFDFNDTPLAGQMVELKNQHLYAVTDTGGRYSFDWRGQPDSLRLVPLSASGVSVLKNAPAPGLGYDFPVVNNGPLTDLAIDITAAAPPRPGFKFDLYLTCRNDGALPADARLSFSKSYGTAWAGFSLIPDLINSDTATWHFSAIPPGGSRVVAVTLQLDSNTPLGSILHFWGKVTPENLLDPNGNNNVSFFALQVVGSYDPNDKAVSPGGNITPAMLADTQRLHYTIRFQNTGTFSAEFIRVLDKISPSLDLGSFRVEASSHPMTWSVEGRTIEFYFPNIQLPDSTSDEPGSHGFVKYSIAMRPDLKTDDIVKNWADIYFDFNAPIRTNTVETKVSEILSLAPTPATGLACYLSPNPAKRELIVAWGDAPSHTAKLQVFDLQGKKVLSKQATSPASLDVSSLKSGVYRVFVQAGEQTGQAGFVKM